MEEERMAGAYIMIDNVGEAARGGLWLEKSVVSTLPAQ